MSGTGRASPPRKHGTVASPAFENGPSAKFCLPWSYRSEKDLSVMFLVYFVKLWMICSGVLSISGLPRGSVQRSEEHTSELQPLMRISYAVFCLSKKRPYQHVKNSIHTKHVR